MRKKLFTTLAIASAILYLIVLFRLLFVGFGRANVMLSDGMQRNYAYNLIPFKTITNYLRVIGRGHASMNLIGNLLLLLPLGFYLPFFVQNTRKIKFYAPVTALFIIVIEVTQLVTMSGSLDVDDFILNFAGALIGYVVFVHTPIRAVFKLRAY